MTRKLSKQIFGVPSTETASRIDDSDATNAACAAHFRFTARMRELEAQFEAGLACAVAGAATNMFRLASKQSSTGFMAARHVLRCFGGPAWKDTANINLTPGERR
jgi:hypothetical protein